MSTPLRDLISSLAVDSTSQAAFAADPAGFLAEHGWADLDGQDVGTALGALADEAPIEQAARLGDLAAGTDGFDGADGAITGLEAAAAVLAEVPAPPNGDADVVVHELDADPDLALDQQERPDDGEHLARDPSQGIDEDDDEPDIDDEPAIHDEPTIDDFDDGPDGPDGPDGLDVSDDELDTSTFRAPDHYEDDGEEAAEPAADAETDPGADLADGPTLAADTDDGIDAGIDRAAGHESFIDTDDDGDAVDVPEPEDDDL